MDPSEPVRVGVIGLGMMGCEHARILDASPAAALIGCADVRPEAADSAPTGCRFFDDPQQLLAGEGIEAVFVATPEGSHRHIVEQALDAGLHVLVEKPIATTLEDADAMIDAANRAQRQIVVGHVLRFDPRYLAVRQAVESGRLGAPIHLTARRNCPLAEGTYAAGRTDLALYLAVHDVDLFLWYAGAVTEVFAVGARSQLAANDTVDTVLATLRFASGAVGALETCWALPDSARLDWDCGFSYVGRSACAYVDIRSMGVVIFGGDGTLYPDTTYWPEVHGTPAGVLRTQDEHFLACVRTGAPPAQNATEARRALEVVLSIQSSLAEGRPVSVPANY